jgi:hypothetical protein
VVLHWERANKVFGKRSARLLNKDVHHGSSSVQVRRCGESSCATPSAALYSQDNLRPVSAVCFPKGKILVSVLLFYSLIMFSEIIIMLCLITSMIELFMLGISMLMIYLFQNLSMQLPNISTIQKPYYGQSIDFTMASFAES